MRGQRLIPSWLRRLLRRPIARARFQVHLHRLRRSLARLERAVSIDQLDLPLMEDVALAWGNAGYAGDAGFLLELARSAWTGNGPVLDCGSGLSTVVAAAITARRGQAVWSLEQDEHWYHDLRRVLAALPLDNVTLRYVPLRSYGEFAWYDVERGDFPSHFAIVACDGPAVRRSAWPAPLFDAWRVGAVPVLRDLGISFDRIVLDDATDPRAPGLLEHWRAAGMVLQSVDTPSGRHIVGFPGTAGS